MTYWRRQWFKKEGFLTSLQKPMKTIHLKLTVLFLLLICRAVAQDPWNKYITNESVTYDEAIQFYKEMDARYPQAKLIDYGKTDNGKTIQLFVISPEKIFNRDSLRAKGYTILMINNGIHPGEPDGINACIRLSKFILDGSEKMPPKIAVCIVPVYNIDGALITSNFFRSGQNGPQTVGFRANSRNLDLNRDFIKCDSENARSFTAMYRAWDPDVFVDTHVTDGADYQYVMTLIDSQKDKLHPVISEVMLKVLLPYLNNSMTQLGDPMTPYVNVWGESPEDGMNGFLETPRFASGYSALFNAFPFVTETHMLKPFIQRVECTYKFLKVMMNACSTYGLVLQSARKQANEITAQQQSSFPLKWALDTTKTDSLFFMGYAADIRKSEVTGLDVLTFNKRKPFAHPIAYRNTFKPVLEIKKPTAYLLPQAWKEVVERMKLNDVEMYRLKHDTIIKAAVYYIRDYKTGKTPYEGHYLHNDVKIESDTQLINCFSGDYIIYCNQKCNRYIIETLEPQAVDAFFAWNFFDGILQQKEWFSDYLWDEEARKILDNNYELRMEFLAKKAADSAFAANSWDMYSWIFERSKWHETSHMRYPVLRLDATLPENSLKKPEKKISKH